MQNQISKPSPSTKVYGEAGLIYIRAPFKVETKADGKTKKIKAKRIDVAKYVVQQRVVITDKLV